MDPVSEYHREGRFELVADAVAKIRVLSGPVADLIGACTNRKAKHRPTASAVVRVCKELELQVRQISSWTERCRHF